jgi:hypothetical protein
MSKIPAFGPRIERETSQIRSRNVYHSTARFTTKRKRKPALPGICVRGYSVETGFCVWQTGVASGCSYRKQLGGKKGCVTVGLNPEIGLPQPRSFLTANTSRRRTPFQNTKQLNMTRLAHARKYKTKIKL